MQEIYFLARHTPFWAVPLIIVGGELSYMMWLKKKKKSAFSFFIVAMIGLIATSVYVWAGGPEKTVKFVKEIQRAIKH